MAALRFLKYPFLVLLIASCATPKIGPYTQAEIQENIYFHFFRKLSNAKLRKKIVASPYTLMRSTYAEFEIQLGQQAPEGGLLYTLPQGLAHGDFHPLQMAWRNGSPVLDDWDTVETKPLWTDLVRMESAARLLASSEGLRAYPESVCIDAYADRFTSGKQSGKAHALRPSAKNEELFEDFSQHPLWKNADSADKIPSDLLVAMKEWIVSRPDLPFKADAPLKHHISGVGSFLKEKILALDADKKLWELKEVDTSPGGCARYEKLMTVFTKLDGSEGENPVRACWSWQGRTFTLLKWDIRYWGPDANDFKSASLLADHVRWMCEKLAEFHQASLSETEIRDWTLALKAVAPLKTRLRELSTEAFKAYQDGYRMILLSQE
ncbi:MAG: hypothetical protein ABIR96_09385 [Bdellovibrionota bacterium]